MKKLLTGFFFCFFLFISRTSILGADFTSYYKTTYEFDSRGIGYVTQEISLVNEKPDLFVSEYTLSLNSTKIDKIQAFDSTGPVHITQAIKDKTTMIGLKFNDKVVGQGKILSFIIKYQSSDLAEKKGNLWEIYIPKLANSHEIKTYQVILKVPEFMGKPTYVNPKPESENKIGGFFELSFNKETLGSKGVMAVFGQWQTFDFSLEYELENTENSLAFGEISLPPDTLYQNVFYESLYPLPKDVSVDENGNWLATYLIPAGQTLKITAKGHVNTFSTAKNNFPQQKENLDLFLKPNKYWETEDPQIKELAEKLKTPKNIYDYVVKTLSYDKSLAEKRVIRKGALSAMINPSSCLCGEFTDLFVALCRAAGIPARELEGYAHSDNPELAISTASDLLHSWPEYFNSDLGHWVMVDPTFENTSGLNYFDSFDYNHFVFVIHGTDSQVPYPAGSFKKNISQKQVNVSFGKDFILEKSENYTIENQKPLAILTLKDNPVEISVRNNNGYALYEQNISLNKQNFFPAEFYFSVVPPFSVLKLSSTARAKETFFDYSLVSNVTMGEKTIEFEAKTISLGLRAGILIGLIVSLVIIMILRSLKRKDEKDFKVNNN